MEKQLEFDKRIIDTLSKCGDITSPDDHYEKIREISLDIKESSEFQFLDQIFPALASSDRILILKALLEKDRCSCEFEALLQKSQPAVSRDLKKLEEVNLIRGWKKGIFIHYSLVQQTFQEFLNIIKDWNEKTTNWFGNV